MSDVHNTGGEGDARSNTDRRLRFARFLPRVQVETWKKFYTSIASKESITDDDAVRNNSARLEAAGSAETYGTAPMSPRLQVQLGIPQR